MSIWVILRNIGFLIQMFKVISGVVTSVATSQTKIPSVQQIKLVLDQVEELLDRGIIDIPGLDEKALSDSLKQIEAQLTGATVEALKNVAKYGDVKGRIEDVQTASAGAQAKSLEDAMKG